MNAQPVQFFRPIRTYDEAVNAIGPLSKTSKMPGASWGIPAKYCQRGSKLRQIKGTACSICYACKGNYGRFKPVKAAYERRFEGLKHPQWVEAMIILINHHVTMAVPYFRWFDSGDLQSYHHLLQIIEIAQRMPYINFWLPTQEFNFVRQLTKEKVKVPDNLIIRVSATFIDGEPPFGFKHTSSVATVNATCPAKQQGGKCLDCRACWNTEVNHVSYYKH